MRCLVGAVAIAMVACLSMEAAAVSYPVNVESEHRAAGKAAGAVLLGALIPDEEPGRLFSAEEPVPAMQDLEPDPMKVDLAALEPAVVFAATLKAASIFFPW